MTEGVHSRRGFVLAGASLAAITLAGCLDDEGEQRGDGSDPADDGQTDDEDDSPPDDDTADGVDDETDDGEPESDDVEPEQDDGDGEADDVEPVLDGEPTTDPSEEDFVDATGEDVVEVITREGVDGEPAFVFDPPFVRVDQGATVRWVNDDGVFHTVTSTESLDNRSGGGDDFDETITAVGDVFEWEAAEVGQQGYYCSPHAGFMYGAVDVV